MKVNLLNTSQKYIKDTLFGHFRETLSSQWKCDNVSDDTQYQRSEITSVQKLLFKIHLCICSKCQCRYKAHCCSDPHLCTVKGSVLDEDPDIIMNGAGADGEWNMARLCSCTDGWEPLAGPAANQRRPRVRSQRRGRGFCEVRDVNAKEV